MNYAKLAAIFKARTPGPWHYDGVMFIYKGRLEGDWEATVAEIRGHGAGLPMDDNACFIAAAGSLADEILAVLEAAEHLCFQEFTRNHPEAEALWVTLDALRAAVAKLPEVETGATG